MHGVPTVILHSHSDRDEIKRLAEAEFVNLFDELGGRRRGKAKSNGNCAGLFCPFHPNSHTPSASIFAGRLRCFACGISLDVIEFVERVQRTNFKSALGFLADRYHVPLETSTLSARERREYVARRRAAEAEAWELLGWRDRLIDALVQARNSYFHAYHRALRYILRYGIDTLAGQLAADAAELFEVRYRDMDGRVAVLLSASFQTLLPFFRGKAQKAA
jgi:hypothetical protein